MAEQLHEWQKIFKLKDKLLQEDFEALEMALFKMPRVLTLLRNSGMSIEHGAYLRAAIQAGWIETPPCRALTDDSNGDRAFFYDDQNVDKMHPGAVKWLGQRVIDRHDAVMKEDPEELKN